MVAVAVEVVEVEVEVGLVVGVGVEVEVQSDFGDFGVSFSSTVAGRYTMWGGPQGQ